MQLKGISYNNSCVRKVGMQSPELRQTRIRLFENSFKQEKKVTTRIPSSRTSMQTHAPLTEIKVPIIS